MKVLQIIDTLSPGGAEKMAVQLANWLKHQNESVSLLCLVKDGELRSTIDPEIPLLQLNRKGRFDLKAMVTLCRIANQFDLLHIHMRYNFRYVAMVCKIFGLRTPLILHDHYGSIALDKSVPIGLKKLSIKANYIGVSEDLTQWAQEKLGLNPQHIFLLENVVEKENVLQSSEKKGLVLVSNIKAIKNHGFILPLMQHLNESLTIIGEIHEESYYEELIENITKNNLNSQVIFMHNCPNVQKTLVSFKLGLHTSLSESGPLVLIEYLAQGLPFLAYYTGNVSRKLQKEFPQYFIDNFDPGQWILRIDQLLKEKPDLEKMQFVFDKYFSTSTYIQKCLKIYHHALAY